jgi:hypothetical protein
LFCVLSVLMCLGVVFFGPDSLVFCKDSLTWVTLFLKVREVFSYCSIE